MKNIKRLLASLFLALLFLSPSYASLGGGGGVGELNLWCFDGTNINPCNTAWGVNLPVGGTADGNLTIDVTNAEALLVRKDSDGGDVFVVDTVAENLTLNALTDIQATSTQALTIAGTTLTSGGTADAGLSFSQTLNDSGAAGGSDLYTGLLFNLTETDVTGWDTVNLMDLQVGGVSKFKVDDTGAITPVGTIYANNIYATQFVKIAANKALMVYNTTSSPIQIASNIATTNTSGIRFYTATDLSSSDGEQQFMLAEGTVNQSGTASYVGFKMDITETATGSGSSSLMDLQVGGTSKFLIDDTGQIETPVNVKHIYGADGVASAQFSIYTDGSEIFFNREDGYAMQFLANSTQMRFRASGGMYFAFGVGSTSHSLSQDDVFIKNDLEVDGASFFDGNVMLGGNAKIIAFAAMANTSAGFYTRTDYLQHNIWAADSTGNQWVFGNVNSSFSQDFDHPTQTDPTWYFHSDTDPNTNNTQWLALSHNQTDAVLDVGTGGLNIVYGDSAKGGVGANGSAASTNVKTATTELTALSGATATATNLIPDGAFVVGVTTRITTALGTTNGTTSYQVGDGTDADRWGDSGAVTLGTTTDNTDATADFSGAFLAANDVVLTAVGGNFDGTGAVRIVVHYIDVTAPTS